MPDVYCFQGVILNRFEEQCVIVTGAGSGFGEATAKRFASEKANVGVSDVEATSAKKVCEEIQKAGGKAISVTCDVSVEDDMEHLVAVSYTHLTLPTILRV